VGVPFAVVSEPSTADPSLARWFARGAIACAWAGGAAWAWATLAQQAPGSPWAARGFYEPIEALAIRAWVIAAMTLACVGPASRGGLFAPAERARARAVLGLWIGGTALSLGAMGWAGATGVLGVQLRDAGQTGHGVLFARWLGGALSLAALALAQRAIAGGMGTGTGER
jgi:hypothetical protein